MFREVRATFVLAWPVVLAEVGWVLMGVVDTIIVGSLGPAAIGAVGTGSTIFLAFMVLGVGTFFALDTFVAQSYGAGLIDECHRWLVAGLHLALILSVVLVAVGFGVVAALPAAGVHPEVLVLLQPYLAALLWSALPLLLFTVLRRYLQAMNRVRVVMAAVVLANVINAAANYVLVYGAAGIPAFGVVGSAYATLAARLCMVLVLCGAVWMQERELGTGLRHVSWLPAGRRMWRLTRLGLPAAFQVMLEVGVFAAAGTLAGRISPTALAANQIVLHVASFFFMVPLGLASAAAVRVGQAVGRRDAPGARRAGWSALALTSVGAAATATILLAAPTLLLKVFTGDSSVLATGATLIVICAVFQPFDGAQAVATGALRGLGNTRTAMWCNLAGHWGIGLPLAYVLCFTLGWGVVGLWTGLATSLMLIGVALLLAWRRQSLALSFT